MHAMGWVFVAIGLFSLCGALFDWEWFFNSRRAWLFVKVLGRGGARVFYALLGIGLVTFGILFLMGMLTAADGA